MNVGSDVRDVELDIINAAGYLDLPPSRLEEALEKRTILQNWGKYQNLFRFDKGISGIERGSSLYQGEGFFELVRGFPKIQRAMLLKPALDKHFLGIDSVAVEEKMNGYNLRIARIDGKLVALTRGGLVCPYSTERAEKLLGNDFFDDHPDLVLCGEMTGPDNPYVPKDIYGIESLELFVFDIRKKGSGEPYPVRERRELAEEYGFRQVKLFGEFPISKAYEEITEIIKELGSIGHEGVVIKDPAMVLHPMKYTCSQSNCADLMYALKFYNDVGRDYLFSRIVREGFQSVEWGEDEKEVEKRCLRLGESILHPMIKSIRHIGEGERIWDDVRIRIGDMDTLEEFKEYLRRLSVDAVFEEPQKIEDEYLVKIKKINKSTNDKTISIWKGDLW